jgi:ubiquinone biosynthesis UbiH/UbiF/VisC/COQ6 family hydroxylase
MTTQFDVIIIGAGPAGLGLARSLADSGLAIALVERQPRTTLEAPPFDGREIALTHRSADLLRSLSAWDRIPAADISPLGEARVLNGPSTHALRFHPTGKTGQTLGYLAPNHAIRRALFETVAECPNIHLLEAASAADIETDQESASLILADGTRLSGRLIVAADTSFSEMRRRMGIAARMRDFGNTMLVCRMAHEQPHGSVATEWFGYGQTIAMLPLNGNDMAPHLSSLVLTLPGCQIEHLMGLDADAFAMEIGRRHQHRLGTMRLVGTRHAYPLVGVYADRFVAPRFALVGDAAVGMHPVTAHGFNLGILGARTLADLVNQAVSAGADIGATPLLSRYETIHRRATRPLYLATNATALLYTDDRLPARILRDVMVRAGEHLPPFRHAVAARLLKVSSPTQGLSNRRPVARPLLAGSRSV